MKLRRLRNADFVFTAIDRFEISLPNSTSFPGESVNDKLYIWESSSHMSKAVTTHSASKKQKVDDAKNQDDYQVRNPTEEEQITNPQAEPTREQELPLPHLKPTSPSQPKPLYCTPNELWHLRFGHASSTRLGKLRYIKSNHDSTHCVICIHAKQTHKPHLPAESKVTRKLE